MEVISEELKGLMRRFPLGVAVVTTKWRDKLVGMTVNTFNSLSMSPPLALFLADRTRGNDVPFRESEFFPLILRTTKTF